MIARCDCDELMSIEIPYAHTFIVYIHATLIDRRRVCKARAVAVTTTLAGQRHEIETRSPGSLVHTLGLMLCALYMCVCCLRVFVVYAV